MNRWSPIAVLILAFGVTATTAMAGVCEPLSPVSETVGTFGVDYSPRVGFRPDDDGLSCAFELSEDGTTFPVYAWNVGAGATGAALRLVTDGTITAFHPGFDFTETAGLEPTVDGAWSVLDIQLTGGPACGPVLLGEVVVAAPEGADGVWVDVDGFGGQGAPAIYDADGMDIPARSPFHGAYAGAEDLYHCQPALCAEPLAPIADLTAVQTGGAVIELGWTAGSGDYTMIRYRDDGTFPTSVFDGELLTLFPSMEGQWQAIVHTNPEVPEYNYTAFSVVIQGGTVELGSRLECGSFVTASVDESIGAETLSWGGVKSRFR